MNEILTNLIEGKWTLGLTVFFFIVLLWAFMILRLSKNADSK